MISKITEAPPLCWPPGIRRPSVPPVLVYLDQNHWIYLAQAAAGHPQGAPYRPVLEQCRAARAAGRALFPLAATHYAETVKITDPAQRRALAAVMEELSGFATLIDRTVLARLELDAVLTDRFGPLLTPPAEHDVLGFGVAWAFGKVGGLRWRNTDGTDVTAQIRDQVGALRFDLLMAAGAVTLERTSLAGPTDQEVPALRAAGWDPHAATAVMAQRAAQEQGFQHHLAQFRGTELGKWTRGERLRDVVLTRELVIELQPILDEVLPARGLTLADVFPDRDDTTVRTLVRAMPSSEVATTLKVEDHRNPDKSWTSNDIFDIDALSLAVPYCDVVICDRHRCHVLRTGRLDERMNTVILAKLTELPRHLLGTIEPDEGCPPATNTIPSGSGPNAAAPTPARVISANSG